MSVKTYSAFNTKRTPQNQPIPGSKMVPNSAGGYGYKVGPFEQLDRFLILGTEGGSYYASEQALTKENASVVIDCINKDGLRTVNRIVEISKAGRAPKNDPAIFALAIAISLGNEETRKAAREAVPSVCRIGTHIMHFAKFATQFRGWGRGLKTAVGSWFTEQDAEKLAYQAVKYQARDGWSQKDLLILSHPTPRTQTQGDVFDWIVGRENEARGNNALDIPVIQGYSLAQSAISAEEVANIVRDYNLPHEALPTQYKWSNEVANALVEKGMPVEALVRNLGNLTRADVFKNLALRSKVVELLNNEEAIRKSRIHPVKLLAALLTYSGGRGIRGTNSWDVVPQIVDALDSAFYLAFQNVEKTDKRIMIGLDTSSSMTGGVIAGVPGLTPRLGSAAMAAVTMASAPNYMAVGFTTVVSPCAISPKQRLDDIVRTIQRHPNGGTNCALPIEYAIKNMLAVDAFVIYTDSETWAGTQHVSQAIKVYRKVSGIDAKLVVVGMVANSTTISDPDDLNCLDVVGFDTSAPQLIQDFITGGF